MFSENITQIRKPLASIRRLEKTKMWGKSVFSGNSIQDSLVHITWNNTTNKKSSIGRIFGKVVYPDALNGIAIHAFNSATGERNVAISDSSGKFMFDNLSSGFYYLQAYENHESNLSDFYPYFGGSWDPFSYSKKFSEFIFG